MTTKKVLAYILSVTMIFTVFSTLCITAFAESTDLDLSVLTDIDTYTKVTEATYEYEWDISTVESTIVRTLNLTLKGADIGMLKLPNKDSYDTLNITINTETDSSVNTIADGPSYNHWDSITFTGAGKLSIESSSIQGSSNDNRITIAAGAHVEITGEYSDLMFGISGNNYSTLTVNGSLQVNRNIGCGHLLVGETGHLKCGRIKLSGTGADMTGPEGAFIMKPGAEVIMTGDSYDVDEHGNQYAALVVLITPGEQPELSDVIQIPEGSLPPSHILKKVVSFQEYIVVDDGDANEPTHPTGYEFGVIYAATSLSLSDAKHTITWIDGDGNTLKTESVSPGTTPSYDGETPTKTATQEYTYTFNGNWSPAIVPAVGDETYTAQFDSTLNKYSVTFNTNGGSDIAPVSLDYGTTATKPTDPTKSGYTFDGWYTDSGLTTVYDFALLITDNITLYAKWSEEKPSGFFGGGGGGGGTTRYTVTFETNGGSHVEKARVARNKQLDKPADPTKEGFAFDGWYTDKELLTAYDFEEKVTKNFTLYAKWAENSEAGDAGNTEDTDDTGNVGGSSGHDCPSLQFDDLDISLWYHPDTDYVIENNIFKGMTKTLFAPDGNMTRAMMVTVLYRAEGEPEVSGDSTFTDIDKNDYYAKAVVWGQQNGIIKGYSATEFRPGEAIIREQIAAIMHRYAQFKGYDVSVGENTNILSYEDFDLISEYAIPAMQWANGIGMIVGRTETTLNPKDTAKRVEIAAMLHRFLENKFVLEQ